MIPQGYFKLNALSNLIKFAIYGNFLLKVVSNKLVAVAKNVKVAVLHIR